MNTSEMLIKHREEVVEYQRLKRKDAGVKRSGYKSILPTKYRSYVCRANRKQIAFDLTVEEFNVMIVHPCVYCGSNDRISLDRINYREGYVKDNVQPCCIGCNQMKFIHPPIDFIAQVRKIARHLNLCS